MFSRKINYLEKGAAKQLQVSISAPVVREQGVEATCEVTFSGSYVTLARLSGLDEMQAAQIALNFAQTQIDAICGDEWKLG